jgi:pyruvate dehydrogenase E1 component beta subunit
VDITRAAIRRPGRDLSLVTYGLGVSKCLEAAELLAKEGIEAEVIDLRVLRPLDEATVLESVSRTHRMLLVEDAWRSVGLGAELSARVTEKAFYELDAPVQRLAGLEVHVPYPKHLEEACVPQPADIVNEAHKLLKL